jgi:hypothetical protein
MLREAQARWIRGRICVEGEETSVNYPSWGTCNDQAESKGCRLVPAALPCKQGAA